MRKLIKLVVLIFISLIIFAQDEGTGTGSWLGNSGFNTSRHYGAPVMDKVSNISNPNYQTYHIVISSATGETLEIYGYKVKVDEITFCAICKPKMKYGVIEPSLIDPKHPTSDRYKKKKIVAWSYTQVPPLRPHPDTFWIPERAIVKCQTIRWDNNIRWIIFEGEARA